MKANKHLERSKENGQTTDISNMIRMGPLIYS